MPIKRTRSNSLYGYPNPQSNQFPDPIVTNRAPTTADHCEPGQIWVDQTANAAYYDVKTVGGLTTWVSAPSASVTSLTINPGDLTVTTGDVLVLAGNITAPGAALGNVNVSGNFDQSGGDVAFDSTVDFAVTAASDITLSATGDVTINASGSYIDIGTAGDTSTINIGVSSSNRTVVIGNNTGTTSVTVDVGTGDLDLGVSATAHATNVGSTTAGATLVLNTPTGVNTVAANGLSVTAAGRGLSLPGGLLVLAGAGDPNTAVTAPIGSLFLRSDPAGATSRAYINTDAGTTWTNITCAA